MSSTPPVHIIILNWNGIRDTRECLASVRALDDPNFHVLVVDNGSRDDSVAVLKRDFPDVTVIENSENLGFAEGNNVGIRHAFARGAAYILLLNNDTIVDPALLRALRDAQNQLPNAGMIGAKIYYYTEPQKIWYAGAGWNSYWAMFSHVGKDKLDDGVSWETPVETGYACGCALWTGRAVIERIGLLDQRYFNTWEEADWSYRARRAGLGVWFVPQAKLWHKISASFSGGYQKPHYAYFWTRNRLLWVERNLPPRTTLALYRRRLLPDLRRQWDVSRDPNTPPAEKLTARAGVIGARDYFSRRFGQAPAWLFEPTMD